MSFHLIGLLLVPFMVTINVLINNRSVFSWACIGVVFVSSIIGLIAQWLLSGSPI